MIIRRLYKAIMTRQGRGRLRRLVDTFVMNVRLSLGRGRFSYRLSPDRRFVVYPEDRLSKEIYLGGGYEPTESHILANILVPGDVMFDVGANIGYYSALCSRQVGKTGRVYAFEPGPRTYERLRITLEELGCDNVIARAEALADQDGMADFSVSLEGRDAQQGFGKHPGLEGSTDVVSVPTLRMDSFVSRLHDRERERLKLIKCDVEGGELSVLRGAKDVLGGPAAPFWLLEYNRHALQQASVGQQDILANFQGCTVYYVPLAWPPSPRGEPARRMASFDETLPDECNLFIVPPARVDDPVIGELMRTGMLVDHRRATTAPTSVR